MCQMWLRIRTGVLWDPARKLACAVEAMDLNKVKSIFISMDPFHKDNYALRFILWFLNMKCLKFPVGVVFTLSFNHKILSKIVKQRSES